MAQGYCRERLVAQEIREEFCRRVIPSHLIVHLRCLQQPDEEKVRCVEEKKGSWYGAEELLSILQRRSDWVSDLTKALKTHEVGLVDLGERFEGICQEIKVTVDVPKHLVSGEGREMEHDENSEGDGKKRKREDEGADITSDGREGMVDTNNDPSDQGKCTDGIHCSPKAYKPLEDIDRAIEDPKKGDTERKSTCKTATCEKVLPSTSTKREEMVYTIFQKLFESVKTPEDIPETMAYGKSIICEIENLAHKCIEITFRMHTIDKLEAFWNLFNTGGLKAALSRDILTPQKRHLMKKEAESAGIHINKISLDVSIHEDNYLFVKDVLHSREEPLLARNTVESIILHGERSQNLTQHKRNEALKKFRASLPLELEAVFDDPFIQDKVPEYFVHLVALNPREAVGTFYNIVAEKLKKEIALQDIKNETVQAVVHALSQPGNDYTSSVENEIVNLTFEKSNLRNLTAAKRAIEQITVSTTDDGNIIKVISDLVLAYIDVNCMRYLSATSDLPLEFRETVQRITRMKFFPLIAGFMIEPLDLLRLMNIIGADEVIPHYLVYRSLFDNDVKTELFNEIPILHVNNTKEIPYILDCLPEEGFELRFCINVPTGTKLVAWDEGVRSRKESENSESDQNTIHVDVKIIRVMINTASDELNNCVDMVVPRALFPGESFEQLGCIQEELHTARMNIPNTFQNPLSLMIAIARMINLIGSGKVKLEPRFDIDQEGNQIGYDLIYRSLPSSLPRAVSHETIDETDIGPPTNMGPNTNANKLLDIDLMSYPLGNKEGDFTRMESALQNELQVNEINLTETSISALQVSRLCRAGITSNISRLILSENVLFKGNEDLRSIGLEFMPGLELLELRNCRLGDTGVVKIGSSLQKLRKLRSIDFSKNKITETGLKVLCRDLRENRGLRAVRLHENANYGTTGGLILRLFLENLTYLEIVNVCFCGLNDKGLEHLACGMKDKKLRKINIRHNNIKQDGSRKFFDIMRNNKNINHLEYGDNEIGGYLYQDDVSTVDTQNDYAFLEMMKSNAESLEYLGLWKCNIGRTTLLENADIISRFSLLTEFVLQSNDLQEQHAATIGQCLGYMKNIQLLMLRDNNILSTGAKKLTKGLAEAQTLREIILDRNRITDISTLVKLVEVTTQNLPDLVKLDISYNVDMLDITSEGPKYKHLIATAEDSLLEPDTEREDFQTKIEGWSKLRRNEHSRPRSSNKTKSTLIVI